MNRLWIVFSNELRRSITRRGYLFATFGVPLLVMAVFFGYPAYQSFQTPDEEDAGSPIQELDLDQLEVAGIVDNSGVFVNPPERFAEAIIAFDDEASARAALESGEIDIFLIFPEDYLETGEATLHLEFLNLILAGEGQSFATQLAYSTFATGLDEIRLSRLNNPAIYTDFDLSVSGQGSNAALEDGRFIIVYAFAVVFVFSLILTNTYLMQTVVEERDNRIIEILIATITPTQLLAGKILAMAVLGMAQVVVWVTTALGLLSVAGSIETYSVFAEIVSLNLQPEMFALGAVYFVLVYLVYAAIFGTIGAVTGSAQEGSQYAGLLTLPVMLPFLVFSVIENAPNGAMAIGLSFFPLTAPVTILARSVVASVPFWQVGLSLALLAVFAAAGMWMAGRIFRVQTLLSGNKLKISDIPRLIIAG